MELDNFLIYGYAVLQLIRFFKEQEENALPTLVIIIALAYAASRLLGRQDGKRTESAAASGVDDD